jgi:hypothetical protein
MAAIPFNAVSGTDTRDEPAALPARQQLVLGTSFT